MWYTRESSDTAVTIRDWPFVEVDAKIICGWIMLISKGCAPYIKIGKMQNTGYQKYYPLVVI